MPGETGKMQKTQYVENKRAARIKAAVVGSLSVMFAVVAFLVVSRMFDTRKGQEEIRELQEVVSAGEVLPQEAVPGEVLPKLAVLYQENPELAGWLTIEGTKIDYPVMYRAGDNDYYLAHGFHGEESRAGLLVLDKHCDPSGAGVNLLIHGHNMKNGDMFGSLSDYTSQAFFLKHPVILFDTLYEERSYDVMAVFRSSVNENSTDFRYYEYLSIADERDFNIYYLNAKAESLYETGVFAEYGDELITLSTCEYTKENGRLVVLGRRRK